MNMSEDEHCGGLTCLPELTETFDFIFFDVFNGLYPQLLEPCLRVLNPNGVLLADDTLEPVFKGNSDIAMHTFNTQIAQHPQLISTLLPIGDGITLALKK
jgi:predicted O-methyltransferase YrrM